MKNVDWLVRCDRIYSTLSYALSGGRNPDSSIAVYSANRSAEMHLEVCALCRLRMKFASATFTRLNHQRGCHGLSLVDLISKCIDFERNYIVDDIFNKRFVVKQGYCFCGERANTIPLPLREAVEQRANSECSACSARWRVAHCRQGCGAPLDDRFDELCDKCRWIKCPAGHCSNADCDD